MLIRQCTSSLPLSPLRSSPVLAIQSRFAAFQPGQRGGRQINLTFSGQSFIPSLWKYYHRHGYWARRKKLVEFQVPRRWHYTEKVGPGKRKFNYYFKFAGRLKDKSYYKPLKNYCRF